jgi:2-oxoglutarate/2-oxoacid ferredoxin oxidoreductase subunit beta
MSTTLRAAGPGSTHKDYHGKDPIWCPGCGDFGVLRAMQQAAVELQLPREDTVLVTGIGCSGNITAYFRTYGFHGIHGRALPAATGIKLANPALTVLVAGGDGDGFGIGLGHFMHAARRNVDVTYIVMDNQVYGLTKGQTSPTTAAGMTTKASPLGPMADPVNPLELALAGGATFVAQAFSADMKGTVELLKRAIRHRGFSLVNIQSPCVTYNELNTFAWFRERLVPLAEAGHDASDLDAAHSAARAPGVPIGVLYETQRPTFTEQVGAPGAAGKGKRLPGPVAAAADPAAAAAAARGPIQGWADAFRVR